MTILIKNGKVITSDSIIKTSLQIEDGIITKIGNDFSKKNTTEIINARGKFILPGFIDIHTNGIAGFDLTNGLYDIGKKKFSIKREKYLVGLDTALKEYAKHGTTLVGFTTLESSIKKMEKIFELIAKYKNKNDSDIKDIFHGIYMEGTFMRDKKYRGAHNPKYFFKPSIKLFKKFQSAADGNIKIVNVVPEWGKSALQLIEFLNKDNIICAAGHTSATGDEYSSAVNKGLRLAIHVLNGPSSSSFKPFDRGGSLETFLTSDKVYVEIIPDGYHVDKAYLLDIIKRKGIDKSIAVSDSMFATKLKGINEFVINGVKGKISKNKKYITIADREDENSLFGSVLTMDNAFENLLNWFSQKIEGIWNREHKPLNFNEALLNAVKMCSVNPAKILGLYGDEKGNKKHLNNNVLVGSIEVGKRADIIIADIVKQKNAYKFNIEKVFHKGKIIS